VQIIDKKEGCSRKEHDRGEAQSIICHHLTITGLQLSACQSFHSLIIAWNRYDSIEKNARKRKKM
jgi:hypothetical protein